MFAFSDVFIATTRSDDELSAMQSMLMENVYHVSGALTAMEQTMKASVAGVGPTGGSPSGSARFASGQDAPSEAQHDEHTEQVPVSTVRMVDDIITTL